MKAAMEDRTPRSSGETEEKKDRNTEGEREGGRRVGGGGERQKKKTHKLDTDKHEQY